jgi:hypothetical protein
MILTISGTSTEIRVNPDYQPITKLAVDWFELSNGDWETVDWGTSADTYETIINTFGTETYINNIISALNDNRNESYCVLSGFASNEKIFGDNINYTNPLSALFTGYMETRQSVSLNGFGVKLSFKLVNPSFVGSNPLTSDDFKNIAWSYEADREVSMDLLTTIGGQDYTYDNTSETGTCKINVNMSSEQLIRLRNFYRIYRGYTWELGVGDLPGIEYPFGPKSSTGPHNVKIKSIQENRFGLNRWLVEIVLVEVKAGSFAPYIGPFENIDSLNGIFMGGNRDHLSAYGTGTYILTAYTPQILIQKLPLLDNFNHFPYRLSLCVSDTSANMLESTISSSRSGTNDIVIINDSNVYVDETLSLSALGQTSRPWESITDTPQGDVYATVQSATGIIFKQTSGVGNFEPIDTGISVGIKLTVASNNHGDLYLASYAGDIYKQDYGTTGFSALGQTSRNWNSIKKDFEGNIYACDVYTTGLIYKQNGGVGNFVPFTSQSINLRDFCILENGDIYGVVFSDGIYKQNYGTSSFNKVVDLNFNNWTSLDCDLNNNIFATYYNDDIYRKDYSTSAFVAQSAGNKLWTSIHLSYNGNRYATVFNDDIYYDDNQSNSYKIINLIPYLNNQMGQELIFKYTMLHYPIDEHYIYYSGDRIRNRWITRYWWFSPDKDYPLDLYINGGIQRFLYNPTDKSYWVEDWGQVDDQDQLYNDANFRIIEVQ